MLTQSDETKSGTKQNEMGDVRTVSLLFVLGKRKTPIHDTFSSQDFDHQTEHHNNHRNPKRYNVVNKLTLLHRTPKQTQDVHQIGKCQTTH